MKPSTILIFTFAFLFFGWLGVLHYAIIGTIVSIILFGIYITFKEKKLGDVKYDLRESLFGMLPKYNEAFPPMTNNAIWFNLVNGYMYDDAEEKDKYFRNSEMVYIADPLYVYLVSRIMDIESKVSKQYDWNDHNSLLNDIPKIKDAFQQLIDKNVGVLPDNNNRYNFNGNYKLPKDSK